MIDLEKFIVSIDPGPENFEDHAGKLAPQNDAGWAALLAAEEDGK
jgi:hypothetical protein